MKKQYSVLLSVIFAEFIIMGALNKMQIQAHSWFENATGIFLFLLPIQLLLYLLGKDNSLSKNERICFKIAFWFIIICYLLGAFAAVFQQ